jgi:mxaA protein
MEINITMMNPQSLSFAKCIKLAVLNILALLMLSSAFAMANDAPSPNIPADQITLYLKNPDRDVGYTVGDTLTRHIRLEVKKPYRLIPTSLPIVGYERRYKNQVTGIEVRKIDYQEQLHNESRTYLIEIEYQVFTTGPTAKPVALPTETIKFQGSKKDEVVQFSIPSFRFRVSPLAVFGAVKIEYDMSTFRAPFLLQTYPEKQKLIACLIILSLSLLSLLYIIGSRAWLPFMGRPFAQAYRIIKKQRADQTGVTQAIASIHQALNTSAKFSVFNHNIKEFYTDHPNFQAIQDEMNVFFKLSDDVFFSTNQQGGLHQANLGWLKNFCRQCRDCERGLKPSLKPVNK